MIKPRKNRKQDQGAASGPAAPPAVSCLSSADVITSYKAHKSVIGSSPTIRGSKSSLISADWIIRGSFYNIKVVLMNL